MLVSLALGHPASMSSISTAKSVVIREDHSFRHLNSIKFRIGLSKSAAEPVALSISRNKFKKMVEKLLGLYVSSALANALVSSSLSDESKLD